MPPLRFSSAHHLIRSPFPRRLASSSSAHRLAPCLVSPGSPPHSTSGTGRHDRLALIDGRAAVACLPRMAAGGWRRTDGGVCLLASDGNGRRAVIDGGWLRAAAWLLACLGSRDGAARSFLDRSSFPLIVSSNRRGPGSFHHLIVSSTGRNLLSIFARPPPAGSSRLACSGLVPPSPAGGCEDLCHGLRRRAGRLLVCVLVSRAALSLLLVRSLLYDLRRSCRSFLPGASLGVLWAFLTAILSALAFLKTCP